MNEELIASLKKILADVKASKEIKRTIRITVAADIAATIIRIQNINA